MGKPTTEAITIWAGVYIYIPRTHGDFEDGLYHIIFIFFRALVGRSQDGCFLRGMGSLFAVC